jgi:hypothetical protein
MKNVREITEELSRLVPGHNVVVTRHDSPDNEGRNWVAATGSGLSAEHKARYTSRLAELRKSDPQIDFE